MAVAGLHVSLSEIANTKQSVFLDGCLDMEGYSTLRGLLDRLLSDVGARILATIEFDFTQLYLMNSTAISTIASWVKRLKDEHPDCRVHFRTNPNLAWQRRALGSIRRIAETIVTID
jgi:hypothetical protein